MPISVLLADDATIIRDAIRGLLDSHPEVMVIGEASTFAETIRLMEKLKPNIIVMDLHMPNESRVRPTDVKAQLSKGTSLLLAISIWNDADTVALADSFGASKLLNKIDLAETLMPTIVDLLQPCRSHSATAGYVVRRVAELLDSGSVVYYILLALEGPVAGSPAVFPSTTNRSEI